VRIRSSYQGASFFELLEVDFPHLKPNKIDRAMADAPVLATVPHGTTVLALRYSDGVLMAGDRLATEGHRVASRDMQKVYPTDDHSLVAIAGAAGPAIEMARMLRIELEHYEKIEGEPLELEGKANKLSQMVRANLPAAMQGLVVVPIFAGYDKRRRLGRLWKFDVTGGRYEEAEFESSGSGSLYARESMKKVWNDRLTREEALRTALQALTDAADEDRATGGVDIARGIFPIVYFCTAEGCSEVARDEIERVFREHILVARQRFGAGA
jgi:proteasome beta subunit